MGVLNNNNILLINLLSQSWQTILHDDISCPFQEKGKDKGGKFRKIKVKIKGKFRKITNKTFITTCTLPPIFNIQSWGRDLFESWQQEIKTSERICRRLILTLKMEGWTPKSAPIAISGQQQCSFSIFGICTWIRWTSASSRHYLEAVISWIKEDKKPPQGKCLVFR